MSCSCRAAARASGSSRSRHRHAASRSSPSAVGGLLTLVDHGDTGFLVPERDPAVFAQLRRAVARRSARRLRPWARRGAGARAPVHLELRGRPAAPAVRRPHRPRAGGLRDDCDVALDDRWHDEAARRARAADRRVARRIPGRGTRSIEAIDRGDGDEAPLVRAACAARRRSTHDLAHARSAHVALRGVRDAGAGGERRAGLRARAAPQRAARRRPLRHRRRGRAVPARRTAHWSR